MTWPAPSLVARGSLYAAVALLCAYLVLLLVLLLVAMRRSALLRALRAASDRIKPALEAALVDFLAGGTDDSVFRRYIRSNACDIAESILLFQTTVGGSARDRLCDLALNLGLVQQWWRRAGVAT